MKLIRVTTVPTSLVSFCSGLLRELCVEGFDVIAISSPKDGELEAFGNTEGVRTVGVPMERHISLFRDAISLFRMVRVFQKEEPDIIHSMTPKAGLISMLAGWLVGVPYRIHTFTGLVWPTSTGLRRRLLMFSDRITCFCATHIIPEGEGVKNDLVSGRITSKPLKVLGHGNVRGVDMVYFDRTPEVENESRKVTQEGIFSFLFVGRIVRDKGIKELIAAFYKLLDLYPNTRLLLVGRFEENLDPLDKQTIELINTLDQVVVVGIKTDVRPYYASSDCFVLPSYREGFPNTVLEAGAMGLPCIVTDINGSREIITDGFNGMIVPPKDESALYDAMVSIIKNRSKREAMASNARGYVASFYEQGYVRQCLKDFYKEILS